MKSPLSGVKVIDAASVAAGPTCTRLLADWGADVIKVEPISGEISRNTGPGQTISPSFECYNANKRDIAVNLKTSEGKKIMYGLLECADVFVSNYRTAALKRLGLDYDTLHTRYPKLIWAHLDGFGPLGPESDSPGYDIGAFWCRSGLIADCNEETAPILNVPYAFGDISTGCSLAAGICAALYQRFQTGYGEKVVTSLYGQALYSLSYPIVMIQNGEQYPKSRKHPDSPLMNSYRCKDGRWLMLTALEYDRYFNAVMDVIDRPDLKNGSLSSFSGMRPYVEELVTILDEGFLKMTLDEVSDRLRAAGIAFSPINHIADVLEDTQALENQYLHKYTYPDGRIVYHPVGPIKFGSMDGTPSKRAPRLGENTVDILKGLGYTEKSIDALYQTNIIATPH